MTEAQRQKGMDDWKAAHPEPPAPLPDAESFSLPQGYDDTAVHLANFFQAVATREHVVEDEGFGNNAAIGRHLANHSDFPEHSRRGNAASRTIRS